VYAKHDYDGTFPVAGEFPVDKILREIYQPLNKIHIENLPASEKFTAM